MTDTWYTHNLNPIAFELLGSPVPWYWLNYLFGFGFCWTMIRRMLKNTTVMSLDDFQAYAVWCWIGIIFGGRVGYILVYQLKYFMEHTDRILDLGGGGMSFHGALVGFGVAAYGVSKKRKLSLLSLTDMFTTVIPWPLATGRFCNFLNGELPGRLSHISWAIVFPAPWNDGPRHPSQLYEAIGEGVLLGLIMAIAWPRLKSKTGSLTCLFLLSYGVIRFLTEFTREPDPQLGYVFSGLTTGQILCLLMILASGVLYKTKTLLEPVRDIRINTLQADH